MKLILISQTNTPTQTMLYPEHFRAVQCDRCGRRMTTIAETDEIAKETAVRNGWLIADRGDWLKERHYCPDCRGFIEEGKTS